MDVPKEGSAAKTGPRLGVGQLDSNLTYIFHWLCEYGANYHPKFYYLHFVH